MAPFSAATQSHEPHGTRAKDAAIRKCPPFVRNASMLSELGASSTSVTTTSSLLSMPSPTPPRRPKLSVATATVDGRLNGGSSTRDATSLFFVAVLLCTCSMLWGPTSLASLQLMGMPSDQTKDNRTSADDDLTDPRTRGAAMLAIAGPRKPSSSSLLPETNDVIQKNATAACLLTKDDLSILSEWIAYHYHTLNMRHLVVAVDPTSTASPSPILQRFRTHLPDLEIVEWNDEDFMPDYFLYPEQHPDKRIPDFVPDMFKHASTSRWHLANATDEQVRKDAEAVNVHRFRQRTFLHQCHLRFHNRIRSMQTNGHETEQPLQSLWVLNMDTDEFVVVNPLIRIGPRRVEKIEVPAVAGPGSVFRFLEDMFAHYPRRISRQCLSMPTLLFGCVEGQPTKLSDFDAPQDSTLGVEELQRQRLPTIPDGFQGVTFETVRWRWHAKWVDIHNGFFKTLMDVSTLPTSDPVLAGPYVLSPHQTSPKLCEKFVIKPQISAGRKYPLTTNHYLGSFERYSQRLDGRRSSRVHERRSNMTAGYEDGWTASWLASFVSTVGADTAAAVLSDHVTSNGVAL